MHFLAPASEAPSVVPPAPATAEWNIQQVHADALWAMGYTGQGVVIAGHCGDTLGTTSEGTPRTGVACTTGSQRH